MKKKIQEHSIILHEKERGADCCVDLAIVESHKKRILEEYEDPFDFQIYVKASTFEEYYSDVYPVVQNVTLYFNHYGKK